MMYSNLCLNSRETVPLISNTIFINSKGKIVTPLILYSFFQDYFGGVTQMNTSIFRQLNGYSNQYRGWGGEDDDFLKRLRRVLCQVLF